MSTQTEQIDTDQNVVELHVQPLNEDLSEKVLSAFNGLKVYLTRINANYEDLKIIEKSTALFSYIVPDQKKENSENNYIEIDPDFHDERSNIEQLGKNYVAKVDGFFIINNHRPQIIPVDTHGSAEVKISDDSMYVLVDMYPSIDDHPIPTVDDVLTKIESLGVVAEINKLHLEEMLKEVEKDKIKHLNVSVASGIHPINGVDGILENKTNDKEKLANLNSDDFHKVNPIISVKDGEIIAILHAPTEGEDGKNVFGKTVNAIPGKAINVKLGAYVKYSEENENHIIAKQDGFLNFVENSISITDIFTVNGNIDFKSGNIVGKGSLKVIGNVNNEFSIQLSKNIEIGGYVGDALIEAGQNVIIHGGFLGKGNGIIEAGGDIELKFIENQKVFSRGSLVLKKEALNAQLFVKNRISSNGSNAVIVGGHSIAGDIIEIYSLGNHSGTETIVEVGFDYLKRNSILTNKEKQIALRKTLEEIDKHILEYAQMKRMNPQCAEKVKTLAYEHKRIAAEIETLKEQNLKITNEIYVPTSSKISVNGMTYPGVKIGINGRFLIVQEPLRAKSFVLSADNEVIAV
jgi:uncharacterized protein (DUF342 family)